MLCFMVLFVLLTNPMSGHTRALPATDKALQAVGQFHDYDELLSLDDFENLTSDQSEEPVVRFNSRLKRPSYPEWTGNAWLHLLNEVLANQKRAPPDRFRRGWNRGCFGLKLDRIGAMSGLGC